MKTISNPYQRQVLDRAFQNFDKVWGRVFLVPAYWDCLCSKTEKTLVQSGCKARNAQENPKFRVPLSQLSESEGPAQGALADGGA